MISAASREEQLSLSALSKPYANVCRLAELNPETYWNGILRIIFLEFSPAGGECRRRHG